MAGDDGGNVPCQRHSVVVDRGTAAGNHQARLMKTTEEETMKIAVVTDDGKTVAQHFGRARYYQVWTVEDGAVTGTELRDRSATVRHGNEPGHAHSEAHHHGTHDHSGMVAQISDTDLLLVGGMGFRAREALDDAGIQVIATDITETELAINAWIEGTLTHQQERLH